MSYKTYTTEAIVCGSRTSNTSDKSFLLFSKDAGMLWATAKSVREERSKQRFALQDFSLIKVSLVRGKSGWRIGSAESERNYFAESKTQNSRVAIASAIRLLRQFVRGEMEHQEVFEDSRAALNAAIELPESETVKLKDLFSYRLLYRLGYIPTSSDQKSLLEESNWWHLPPLSADAQKTLARAKEVSHL